MRFEKLILENIGPFAGRNEVDLSVARKGRKGVVLFGGQNGAGKTNILESIKIALYGRRGLGERVSESVYHDEIRHRLHRGNRADDASIAVGFELARRGDLHSYLVTRKFRRRADDAIQEELVILEDGSPLAAVPFEHWQTFIDEILPANLSHLFFFDAERIKELASEDEVASARALEDAVQALFGLGVVRRLQVDLQNLERQIASRGSTEAAKLVEQLNNERQAILARRTQAEEKVHRVQDQLSRESSRKLRLEETFRQQGGTYAQRREELLTAKTRAETQLEQLKQQIIAEVDDKAIFLVCRDLLADLRADLEANQSAQGAVAASLVLDQVKATALKKLSAQALSKFDKSLTDAQRAKLSAYIEGVLADLDVETSPGKTRRIELSLADFGKLLNLISVIETEVAERSRRLALDYELAARALAAADDDLSRIPTADSVAPMMEELNLISQKIGALQSELALYETKLSEESRALADVDRKLDDLALSLADQSNDSLLLTRGSKARRVAQAFGVALAEKRLRALADETLVIFSQLARKKDVVSRLEIDPLSYQLKVFTKTNGLMPKDRFSAGERQMLAISLLWALSKLSGRALPIVIDTPLGRLDSQHKTSLVKNYFTKASHQMVVLSTDEEIDEEFYAELKPSLARTYRLEFDEKHERTQIHEGYFWN
ncbi:MAG TPA: DNA sulfur modification protein DndD [Pseudobdellovibrionaceae bacterium]|nr:DNA sulfur modification protein DndD [Pseudobdellovibrionaceae bacterium]